MSEIQSIFNSHAINCAALCPAGLNRRLSAGLTSRNFQKVLLRYLLKTSGQMTLQIQGADYKGRSSASISLNLEHSTSEVWIGTFYNLNRFKFKLCVLHAAVLACPVTHRLPSGTMRMSQRSLFSATLFLTIRINITDVWRNITYRPVTAEDWTSAFWVVVCIR